MKYFFLGLTCCLLFQTCVSFDEPYEKVAPGYWRGLIYLDGKEVIQKEVTLKEVRGRSYKEVKPGVLPFIFEVKYATPDSFYLEFINGEERIVSNNIRFGNNLETARDTMVIEFPLYNSYIKTIVRERIMQGVFVNRDRQNYTLTFEAYQGQKFQFTSINNRPKADFSGKWKVLFNSGKEDEYPAVGEFEQEGSRITGTFRTETGDYRYLSGDVIDGKMYLGCFDGSHLFRFEAKEFQDTLVGLFKSGSHYQSTWTATRDDDFEIKDANSISEIIEKDAKINFEFPDTDGNIVTLDSEQMKGPVKIVQVLGSWCPNCRDETAFLVDYLSKNPDLPVKVIGVGFEKGDMQQKTNRLRQYKEKMNISYPLVVGGDADKKAASDVFPMISSISAFPTMLILDENNKVIHTHTGFNGPATSKYAEFVKDFDKRIRGLAKK